MAFDVLGCTGFSKSLFSSSRDKQLNERALERALELKNEQSKVKLDLYYASPQVSQDVLLKQIIQEKSSRERVIEMQDEINDSANVNTELVAH